VRDIDGFHFQDAMSCYPLFSCVNWRELHTDMEELQEKIVSISVVTDPFGDYDHEYLRQCFPDKVIPFKEHHVSDLTRPVEEIVSKHHRYYARKALKRIKVEKCDNPLQHLDEWNDLYRQLIERHRITGIHAFSRKAFAQQLDVPGIVMFRALSQKKAVGAHLWYVQGEIAYSHLAASSQQGYRLMASYALHSHALEYFTDRVRWLNLGSGAGIGSDQEDGLSQFKRGWSTETRTAFFCGRILDRERYAEVTAATHKQSSLDYFPAYRLGEFD
jgi:lipid II:glycine glycyltransferase (peptidoglycan interpeptide bridge formation enzyme)